MGEVKPRCRLYLQFPAQPSAKLEALLAHAIESTDAACVLLRAEGSDIDEAHVGRLVDLVQGRGRACLVAHDAALAERFGADGVHIEANPPGAYADARKRLGESASIGAGCGFNRHDAMFLAELGADYVAFGGGRSDIDGIDQCADLIAWWSEIFVVPCVAWDVDRAADAARLAGLGADFVAPSVDIWNGDSAGRVIAEIDSALRQARRAA
jgi:thiamine-phosphate pyrophosphorylase